MPTTMTLVDLVLLALSIALGYYVVSLWHVQGGQAY